MSPQGGGKILKLSIELNMEFNRENVAYSIQFSSIYIAPNDNNSFRTHENLKGVFVNC